MNSTKLRKLNDGIQLLKTTQEAAPDAILAGEPYEFDTVEQWENLVLVILYKFITG